MNPDLRDALAAFVDSEVEFLLVGGYDVAAHGWPRATGDLDLSIRSSAENAARVLAALHACGPLPLAWKEEDLQRPEMIFQLG